MFGETVVATYLLASLALGALFERKASTLKGFLVANRSIRDWVLAFTFGATYFSSVVMIVGSSWAYAWGPITLIIPLANIGVGVLATFIIVGRRVTVLSRRLDALTVPELLAKLHGSQKLQKLVGFAVGVGLFLYLTVVIAGASVVAAKALHVGLGEAAAIVGGVIAFYVALGGMFGVVWTDVIQGVIMASFIAALLAIIASHHPSAATAATVRAAHVSPLLMFDLAMLTSLAVMGLPQMVNRFYTVPSGRAVRRATGVAAVFAYIVALGSFVAGIAARQLVPGIKPINALPALTAKLTGDIGVALLAAAVLAASMSTADSVALTAASALVYDGVGSRSIAAMRLGSAALTIAAAVAAYAMLTMPATVYKALTEVFKTGWTLAASVILIPLIAALYGRPNSRAAVAAATTGLTVSLLFGALKSMIKAGLLTPGHLLAALLNVSFTVTVLATVAAYAITSSVAVRGRVSA